MRVSNMQAVVITRLPTPVQTECLPLILGGGDVMAVSLGNVDPLCLLLVGSKQSEICATAEYM